MRPEELLDLFRRTGALLEGHFILSSGRHSGTYFQCARLLQHPRHLSRLAEMIGDHYQDREFDLVISPAVGGIVLGTEVGRQLECRTIFAEREEGRLRLRRGFEIQPAEKVLVVEDVITTGGSVQELIDLVSRQGGRVLGVAVLVDRSGGTLKLHPHQFSILEHKTVSYAPGELPLEIAAIKPRKPGSRSMV